MPKAVKAAPAAQQLTVVGIGASAGGLEACTQLLKALPEDAGLAMVLVQHLAPHHPSVLADLLGGATSLPVVQVTDGMPLEPNHVYVIPPNVYMKVSGDTLQLSPRAEDGGQFMPIDFFFRSLSESYREKAIGIVLSGTASDGAIGLREIKGVGGVTMAQEPKSAKYDGMPRAAMALGVVDLVLPPEALARELVSISRHPLLRAFHPPRAGDELELVDDHYHTVLHLLKGATGVDFTHYKQPTLRRRIQRRMVLHKIKSTEQYIKFLQKNRQEIENLFHDILINVTRFFREPESFTVLSQQIFPRLLEDRRVEDPIRVWIPGCSTGEEAYSVAMCLIESLGDRPHGIQVFGTDVSERAIERARAGWYAESISADVSAERLQRFFTKADGGYKINKSLRELCIFARQDLTRDPPFSKLDLVVCRNVLIYLDTILQKNVLTVFHYALKPNGFLVLGPAETTGPQADLFSVQDRRNRVYSKKSLPPQAGLNFALPAAGRGDHAASRRRPEPTTDVELQSEANRIIAARSPPGVIVDGDLQIVQFRGQTGAFLQPAPGDPSLNVLKMAREGLHYPLRTALHEARKDDRAIKREGIRVESNGQTLSMDVEVVPLRAKGSRRHYLVLFLAGSVHEQSPAHPAPEPSVSGKAKGRAAKGSDRSIKSLQEELAASRVYLQSIIQDLEAANEELQSANEEILSSNEELQSTNEELDTAREELQSTNEEINTVNEELHGRNEELSRVNSDLVNILASVQIAILMVDRDLRIRRFTPLAERILNVIPADIGRPLGDLKLSFDSPDLEALITEVITTISTVEREIRDRSGRWYLLRIRPYKSLDNRIDGAVLSLFDIQEAKQQVVDVTASLGFAEAILETVREPLMVLDGSLRVKRVNSAFAREFRIQREEAEGQFIYDLGKGRWDMPGLRTLLEEVLPKDKAFAGFEVEHELPEVGRRRLVLNGRRLEQADTREEPLILLAMQDVTGCTGHE